MSWGVGEAGVEIGRMFCTDRASTTHQNLRALSDLRACKNWIGWQWEGGAVSHVMDRGLKMTKLIVHGPPFQFVG